MRYELTDDEWAAIKPTLPNKPRGAPRVKTSPSASGFDRVVTDAYPIAPSRRRRIEIRWPRRRPRARARNAERMANGLMPCCCDRPVGEAYPIARPPRRRRHQPNSKMVLHREPRPAAHET